MLPRAAQGCQDCPGWNAQNFDFHYTDEPVPEDSYEARVYQEWVKLYDRATEIHTTSISEVEKALADLRKATAPVPRELSSTQKADTIKVKWDKENKDLKNKVTELAKDVGEATPSHRTSTAVCFNEELNMIKELSAQADALIEKIGMIDPDVYATVYAEQKAIDEEVTAQITPVEANLLRYTRACKALAEDDARRTASRHPAAPTSAGDDEVITSPRPTQGIALERAKCPIFSGKMADYPSFKETWKHLVHLNLDVLTELLKIWESILKEAQVELKNLVSMEEVWHHLDNEYGKINRLAAERIAYLHAFQVPEEATTDSTKFPALHSIWREVYADLEKVKATENFNNPLAIENFMKKLPLSCRDA